MSSRSRKRGRTKRPAAVAPEPGAVAALGEPKPSRSEKTEAKNAAIRAGLEPLGKGDRLPGSLLAAILITTVAGLGNLIAYAAGVEIDGQKPALAGIVGFSGLMLFMAAGMAARRYWAVLGFETLLAIIVVVFSLFLLRVSNLLGLLVSLAFIVGPGYLFFKLVKVMARLQMPERRPARDG